MKKILFIYTDKFSLYDIAWSFLELGFEMEFYEERLYTYKFEDKEPIIERLIDHLKAGNYWFVLSYNFLPSISTACERIKIPYVGWTYDSLTLPLHSKHILSPFNFTYVFDHSEYLIVKNRFNPPHLYYMPLAANVSRLGGTIINDDDIERLSSDISFVGNLYDTDELQDLEASGRIPAPILDHFNYLVDYYVGHWGSESIYDCLTQEECDIINQYMPAGANNTYDLEDRFFYAFMYIGRRIANKDRLLMLQNLGNKFNVNLFGPPTELKLNVNQKGYIKYNEEFAKVAYLSKINLHLTMPRIATGISQRCFDVMASGGFLMANYKEDMLRHFEPDKDFIMYESIDELIDKCTYYLSHDDERKKIALNGCNKVVNEHNTILRAKEMIKNLHSEGFHEK